VIQLDGLSKTFRKARVVDNLSLRVETGERIALIGANGAGKTTLIRCILGEYVSEGDVRVDGLDPRVRRAEVLRYVGFVPQLPPPLKMTVFDLIQFASGVSGADSSRVASVAGDLGLDIREVTGRPFIKLSGGQKQKLLIAIALGRDTRLLILDEPAANLDPAARQTFFQILAARRNDTMIVSSHRVDEVSALVTRVVEMERGRISFDNRLTDDGLNGAAMRARITMTRHEPAFAAALEQWGFARENSGLTWSGGVANPDRLRFLCLLSHYSGPIGAIALSEAPHAETDNDSAQVCA
jgi:ABC-2 type transport system ATP-binding protein